MNHFSTLSVRSLQYYVISMQWSSDLEFFKIEIAFFHHILDRYFTSLTNSTFIKSSDKMVSELSKLEIDMGAASTSLTDQVKHLELMAEDVIPECADDVAVKQIELEYLMTNLTREYRELKKQIFTLVENIMHETRLVVS